MASSHTVELPGEEEKPTLSFLELNKVFVDDDYPSFLISINLFISSDLFFLSITMELIIIITITTTIIIQDGRGAENNVQRTLSLR